MPKAEDNVTYLTDFGPSDKTTMESVRRMTDSDISISLIAISTVLPVQGDPTSLLASLILLEAAERLGRLSEI